MNVGTIAGDHIGMIRGFHFPLNRNVFGVRMYGSMFQARMIRTSFQGPPQEHTCFFRSLWCLGFEDHGLRSLDSKSNPTNPTRRSRAVPIYLVACMTK